MQNESDSPISDFLNLLDDPRAVPSPSLVEALARVYPYFYLPAAVALERSGDSLEQAVAERLRARVALNSDDPSALFRLTTPLGQRIADALAEPRPETPATDDAISTFLERYCDTNSNESENLLLERLIFNPVPPDYAAGLVGEDPGGPDAGGDDGVDHLASLLSEINAPKTPEEIPEETPGGDAPAAEPEPEEPVRAALQPAPEPSRDTTFSESLAKIYVRQRKYSKALEIISNLSLKFPEKSVYFADQIRFLRKLLINENYNQQK
ncbi:MAG: hypothetical protein NC336_08880 [Clostridium sp.]|nr:hypothetical protein [Clostridium sp.]